MTERVHLSTKTANRIRRHERGISLIEVLVGLVIGLLVSIAAIGSLVFTKSSSSLVGDTARLQQDASTIMRLIGHHAREAGARPVQNASSGEAAEANSNVQFDTSYLGYSTSTFTELRAIDGTSNTTDTLGLSHSVDPAIQVRDCLGTLPPNSATTSITNDFSVVNGELRCQGMSTTASIAGGVEDFQVWYGVHSGDNMRYLIASDVADWSAVESILVCLRMSGETQSGDAASLAMNGCNGETVAADGRIRRVFRQVFTLRSSGL
jgi:type IV pilus assembly protein PilW